MTLRTLVVEGGDKVTGTAQPPVCRCLLMQCIVGGWRIQSTQYHSLMREVPACLGETMPRGSSGPEGGRRGFDVGLAGGYKLWVGMQIDVWDVGKG